MNDGVILARPAHGVVGETERVCHVFPIPEGAPLRRITALCGVSFGPGQLERLDGPAGMPCERCLSRTPASPSNALEPPAPVDDETVEKRLNMIERSLEEMQRHIDGLRAAVAAILDDQRREAD